MLSAQVTQVRNSRAGQLGWLGRYNAVPANYNNFCQDFATNQLEPTNSLARLLSPQMERKESERDLPVCFRDLAGSQGLERLFALPPSRPASQPAS